MLPEMLKARPNQKIDNSNRNRTGSTKAASATSLPAVPRKDADGPEHAGEPLTPHPAPTEKRDFIPSKRSPRMLGSIKQNGNRGSHSEGNFCRIGVFNAEIGTGQVKREKRRQHAADIAQSLANPPSPDNQADGHHSVDQHRPDQDLHQPLRTEEGPQTSDQFPV